MRAAVLTLLTFLIAAAPAAAQDAVMSPNVEYLGSIQQDVGLTAGAKILGDRMYVTSGKNLSIYDISEPAAPKALGGMTANIAWENEEVPTNGQVLAVASDFYSVGVPECVAALAATGCVQFFDVRDPANVKQVGTIPIANHTVECALDCQYFYGRAGTIIDARGILEGTAPKVVGNWIDALAAQGVAQDSCHHIRELRPGVLLTACQPFAVISINAEDGGSPTQPKVLYTGEAAKFVHSARWPREGSDKFVLTGGEENFTARCERNNSEFSVYSAEQVLAGASTRFEGPLAQVPPAGNGTYVDGKPVAGALGCSVHWFQEHETFRDGGLVAISEYEDGVRFLQIERRRLDHRAGLLPLARLLVVIAEVGRQGRHPVLDRLHARDRHPALEGRALRAGSGAANRVASAAPNGTTPPARPTLAQAAKRDALAAQLRASGLVARALQPRRRARLISGRRAGCPSGRPCARSVPPPRRRTGSGCQTRCGPRRCRLPVGRSS